MSHVDRERRESCLNIDAGAVPAQHCMDSECKPKVMNARRSPGGRADLGRAKELAK
jgi:hypothetical protein